MNLEPIPAVGRPSPPTPPLPQNTVHGTSSSGTGVLGESNTGPGISGRSVAYGGGQPPVQPIQGGGSDGVLGESQGTGVHGISSHFGDGVLGESQGTGVHGKGASQGVLGEGPNGVVGNSSAANASGVWGENTGTGYGVSGSTSSSYQTGVNGTSGVWGNNAGTGIGVKGTSAGGDGVLGSSGSSAHAGVSAINGSGGLGLWAGGSPAGHFEGRVEISGDLNLGGNLNITSSGDVILNDCAETFDVVDIETEPGTVMVIDQDGSLRPSDHPYDKKVAGVVSGAGNFRPGIILGKQQSPDSGRLIALLGKVYCKVDANYSAIEVGDLLTTSATPGYAMKAEDPQRSFGCVIGKSLRPLTNGQGLIPILIALQ